MSTESGDRVGNWRKDHRNRTGTDRERIDRLARRFYGTLLVLVLLGAFIYFFVIPRGELATLHLVRLTVSGYDRLSAPQLPFIPGDAAKLDRLSSVAENLNYQTGQAEAATRNNFAVVNGKPVKAADTLVVYISALAIADEANDDGVMLRTGTGEADGMPLKTLLEKVSKSTASQILVILDPGWFPVDLVSGRIRNRYLERLPKVMSDQKKKLWLLALNSDGRPSELVMEEDCTLATKLISTELQKSAESGSFSLREFVARLKSNRAVKLYQGGRDQEREIDAVSASTLVLKPKKLAEGEGGADVKSPQTAASEKPGDSTNTSSTDSANWARALKVRPDLQKLIDVWKLRDDLQVHASSSPGSGQSSTIRWTPLDVDPMLWRKLNMQLLAYEHELLFGHSTAQVSGGGASRSMLRRDLDKSEEGLGELLKKLKGESARELREEVVETQLMKQTISFLEGQQGSFTEKESLERSAAIRQLQKLTDAIWTASCLTEFLATVADDDLLGQERRTWHEKVRNLWKGIDDVSGLVLAQEELTASMLKGGAAQDSLVLKSVIETAEKLGKDFEKLARESPVNAGTAQLFLSTPLLPASVRKVLYERLFSNSATRPLATQPGGDDQAEETYKAMSDWGDNQMKRCRAETGLGLGPETFARNLSAYLASEADKNPECFASQKPRRYWLSILADPRAVKPDSRQTTRFPWSIKVQQVIAHPEKIEIVPKTEDPNTKEKVVVDPKPAQIQFVVEPQALQESGEAGKLPRAPLADRLEKRFGDRTRFTTLRTIANPNPALHSLFKMSAKATAPVNARACLVRVKVPTGNTSELLKKPDWEELLRDLRWEDLIKDFAGSATLKESGRFEIIAVNKKLTLSTEPIPLFAPAPEAPKVGAAPPPAPPASNSINVSHGMACVVIDSAFPKLPWICVLDVDVLEPNRYLSIDKQLELSADDDTAGKAKFSVKLASNLLQSVPIPLELQANRTLLEGVLNQEEWTGKPETMLDFSWGKAGAGGITSQKSLEFRIAADGYPRAWTFSLRDHNLVNTTLSNRVRIARVWTSNGSQSGPEFFHDDVDWHKANRQNKNPTLITSDESGYGFGKPADQLHLQLLIDAVGEAFRSQSDRDHVLVQLLDSEGGQLDARNVFARRETNIEFRPSQEGDLALASSVREPEVKFNIKGAIKKLTIKATLRLGGIRPAEGTDANDKVDFVINDKPPDVTVEGIPSDVFVGSPVEGKLTLVSRVGVARTGIALLKTESSKFEGDEWKEPEQASGKFRLDTSKLEPGRHYVHAWVRDRLGLEKNKKVQVEVHAKPVASGPAKVDDPKKQVSPPGTPGVIKVLVLLNGSPVSKNLDPKVVIEPVVRDAKSEVDGNHFIIKKVPPGKYVVKATASGEKEWVGMAMDVEPVAPELVKDSDPVEVTLTEKEKAQVK